MGDTTSMSEIRIEITVGKHYVDELKHRLLKYRIGRNELAREMGIPPSTISRWINRKHPETGEAMIPNMRNIEKIETAILNIRRRRRGMTK